MSRATTRDLPREGRAFRAGFHHLLLDEIAQARARTLGRRAVYSVLSYPSPDSPFLTVAEKVEHEIPAYVVKVLVMLEADEEAFAWWNEEVLKREQVRLQAEFNRRLGERRDGRRGRSVRQEETPDTAALVLSLPVSHPPGDGLVTLAETDYLDADGILEDEHGMGAASVRFPYLVRPYVAWPSLWDVVLSRREREARWRSFCEENGIRRKIAEDRGCLDQFCREALVSDGDLFLTSAWRWGRTSQRAAWATRRWYRLRRTVSGFLRGKVIRR